MAWEHDKHHWGNWIPMSLRTEDDLLPDPDTGKIYFYVRECQVMCCNAKQFAEGVEPVGHVKEVASTVKKDLGLE